MKIGYVIGALNAGGSERQLTQLAMGMHARGHEVQVLCYVGPGVFDSYLQNAGIPQRIDHATSRLAKVRAVRQWMQEFNPDVVHAFLKRSSSASILADLPRRRRGIVATDFSTATYRPLQPALWGSLGLFHFADLIITETQTNCNSLARLAPLLRPKLRIVANGVDLDRFRPSSPLDGNCNAPGTARPFRLLSVGSVCRVKNPVRLVHALHLLKERNTRQFELTFAGRPRDDDARSGQRSYLQTREFVNRYKLEKHVHFVGHVSAIEKQYAQSDALIHISVQEGIPNAVVEAMAAGLPIVASRVSDLPMILQRARNGFLCDPYSIESICSAIDKMLLCSQDQLQTMSKRSRKSAETHFGLDRFFNELETLYTELLERKHER